MLFFMLFTTMPSGFLDLRLRVVLRLILDHRKTDTAVKAKENQPSTLYDIESTYSQFVITPKRAGCGVS